MSTVEAERTKTCECGGTLADGVCLNVNCDKAQAAASAGASRTTAKVAVAGAKATGKTVTTTRPDPRAFNIAGQVD